MATERQLAVNSEDPIVTLFWERFDYLEENEDPAAPSGHINHHRRHAEGIIAVRLNEMEARCAEKRLELPTHAELIRALKTSKNRRFVEQTAVNSRNEGVPRSAAGSSTIARARRPPIPESERTTMRSVPSLLSMIGDPDPDPVGAAVMPWDYIRMRREAAGLSIAQAARPFWHHGAHQADVERNFRRIETVGIRMKRLWSMTRAFPLSLTVYRQLCDTPADRHPACAGPAGGTSGPRSSMSRASTAHGRRPIRGSAPSAPRSAAACSRRACPILTPIAATRSPPDLPRSIPCPSQTPPKSNCAT
jgi:hypothetical protein